MSDSIFVFGSNLRGYHAGGAARFAHLNHGAIMGQGIGLQGNSYAIPTMNEYIQPMDLQDIEFHVTDFINFAKLNQDKEFYVTAIGTGIAGHKHSDISALFSQTPTNCRLPIEWESYLTNIPAGQFTVAMP